MTGLLDQAPARRAGPPAQCEVRVRSMTWEADGVLSLELVDVRGGELPAWEPGAHLDVVLRDGVERQYSLCGDPADRRSWTVAVLHEAAGRGGSVFVHTALRPGTRLTVRGPTNTFPLADAPAYLFVAGGIGITPLLPMLGEAARRGAPWRLLYGGRRRASMAFLDRLTSHGDRVEVRPADETGLLDLDAALDGLSAGTAVYCCGPEPLLAALEVRCAARGVEIHVERFAARPRDDDGGPAGSFEVLCRRSGASVVVGPEQSIIEAVEEAGLTPAYSCLEGVCGTCEIAVLGGQPEHRDSILSPEEQAAGDTMMICVSRSRSPRLVLDL